MMITHLAVGEEEPDALHADLQQSTLARVQVLHRELAAQLPPESRAARPADLAAPRRRPLHRLLDGVVQVAALLRVELVQLWRELELDFDLENFFPFLSLSNTLQGSPSGSGTLFVDFATVSTSYTVEEEPISCS